MENIKKWIIFVVIFIILLLGILLIVLLTKKSGQGLLGSQNKDTIGEADISVDIETTIIPEKDYNTFFSIEKNLQNYCLYLRVGNTKALYELLTQEYISNNQITEENIKNHLPKIEGSDYEFKLYELYVNDNELYPIYYAYGEIIQKQNKLEQYNIVYVDRSTLSIKIEPLTKQEYESKIKGTKQKEERKIQRTQFNELKQITLSKEEIATKYFKNYIYQALHDQEKAYSSLDEEYKKAKYAGVQEYKQYISNKQEQLISMDIYSIKKQEDFATEEEYAKYITNLKQRGLNKYAVTQENDYTQYVCVDDYGNYYIFKETAPMQYAVILDTYTIDLPEFKEKYTNATAEQKVLLNIQKFFEAINNKDYKYAYHKLDNTFKANNFTGLEQFENYIKTNFFEQNKLAANEAEIQGDNYLYKITISDATSQDKNTVTKTFVMQLKEGTDFVMSFSK